VYDAQADFKQIVALLCEEPASQGRAVAKTWTTPGHTGVVGRQGFKKAIHDVVEDFAARFANDYLAANPKQ